MSTEQKLLPFIPTEEMLNAAYDWSVKKYGQGVGNEDAIGCWQAMYLAAQPQAEEKADWDRLHKVAFDAIGSENWDQNPQAAEGLPERMPHESGPHWGLAKGWNRCHDAFMPHVNARDARIAELEVENGQMAERLKVVEEIAENNARCVAERTRELEALLAKGKEGLPERRTQDGWLALTSGDRCWNDCLDACQPVVAGLRAENERLQLENRDLKDGVYGLAWFHEESKKVVIERNTLKGQVKQLFSDVDEFRGQARLFKRFADENLAECEALRKQVSSCDDDRKKLKGENSRLHERVREEQAYVSELTAESAKREAERDTLRAELAEVVAVLRHASDLSRVPGSFREGLLSQVDAILAKRHA